MSTDPHPTSEVPAFPGDVPPARTRHARRFGIATAASLLVAGLITGGAAAAVAMRASESNPETSAYQSPTTTTEQLPFTGSRRWSGSSYGWTPPDDGGQPETGRSSNAETSDATAAQSAGVVQITSTLISGTAAGSGMVLSSDGTVVTNHHVVEGATEITVTVPSTGKTYAARYLGADGNKDIAVLKLVDASGLRTVDLSDEGVDVGDEITSVGDANGDGGSLTAAPGTVTAEDESITVPGDDDAATQLSGLIQVDADLVPGDSGGALLDADGDVVGMNVAASTNTANVTGYAIPIAAVTDVVDAVLDGDESGSVDIGYHGYLGIGLEPSSAPPLVVSTVEGGAADDAGITAGDTITSLNGTAISTAEQLRAALADLDPGDQATLRWTDSDGAEHAATVTLGRAPVA